jgi:hypothetical protein
MAWKKHPVVTTVALVGTVIGAVYLLQLDWGQRTPARTSAPATTAAVRTDAVGAQQPTAGDVDTQRLAHSLQATQHTLAALAARLERLERSRASGPERAPSDNASQAPAAQVTPLDQRRLVQERIDKVNGVFTTDPARAGDAVSVDRDIRSIPLADNATGTQVVSTECSQNLCRVYALHQDGAGMDAFVASVAQKLPWHGGLESHVVEQYGDGSLRTVIFIAREGQALPM